MRRGHRRSDGLKLDLEIATTGRISLLSQEMPSIKRPTPSIQTQRDISDSKRPKADSGYCAALPPKMVKERVIIDTDPVHIWALSQWPCYC